MPDPRGFLKHPRSDRPYRDPVERIRDFGVLNLPMAKSQLNEQASRCMGCGVPFCHSYCPLGNLIPDWNDLVRQERWREAYSALAVTNNFPEFTGMLCPAPCEDSCVLAINDKAVTIKSIEMEIIDRAFAEGWVVPEPPAHETGKRVAVVGSGPAGLAAAQQLRRVGHQVTVFERWDRLGGLIRYGVPDYKMAKELIDRRIDQLEAEGIEFQTGVAVGADGISLDELRAKFDAVALCTGALAPRDLKAKGRELKGIHFAMDYLTAQNRCCAGDGAPPEEFDARGKHVVILGGGDTGADCYGTALRQGAASVTQFDVYPDPAGSKPDWPHPLVKGKSSPVHAEGGERLWSIQTTSFEGDEGRVQQIRSWKVSMQRGVRMPTPVTDELRPADMVLLAIGYEGTEPLQPWFSGSRIDTNHRFETEFPGVFASGDSRRGASLIVWAIAEGRTMAHEIDRALMGVSFLPKSFAL